jgi:hypothetical protein
MGFMEENSPVEVQRCPRCKSSWEGRQEYCPVCATPISIRAVAAQEDEARGCTFFVQITFAMLFGFVGLALIAVGVAAASHQDRIMQQAYFPGAGLVMVSGTVTYFLLRKYQREKKEAEAALEAKLRAASQPAPESADPHDGNTGTGA